MISTFTAFFDANVFYGARLRSLVVYLAQSGTFRARWTSQIHDEWTRSVVARRPDLTLERLQRTRDLMDKAVPDCLVTGYDALIPTLTLPDSDDRHVLAAAIKVGADVIVTFNEKDFPGDALTAFGIHLKHPDDFILDLESLHPTILLDAVIADRKHYKNPPLNLDVYFADLKTAGLSKVAEFLSKVRVAIDDKPKQ